MPKDTNRKWIEKGSTLFLSTTSTVLHLERTPFNSHFTFMAVDPFAGEWKLSTKKKKIGAFSILIKSV